MNTNFAKMGILADVRRPLLLVSVFKRRCNIPEFSIGIPSPAETIVTIPGSIRTHVHTRCVVYSFGVDTLPSALPQLWSPDEDQGGS